MSIRPLTGMVQALLSPGALTAAFISLISSSLEIVSEVIWRRMRFAHSGAQEEYHVSTGRHWERGLSVMSVSSIDRGAGSVAVSALPAFPRT